MNQKNLGVIIFFSLLLSSCGLIEKFKTPETASQSTENTSTAAVENPAAPSDDLFTSSTDNTNQLATGNEAHTDAPSNITTEPNPTSASTASAPKDELADLQNEFTGQGPQDSSIVEKKIADTEAPAPKAEMQPETQAEAPQVVIPPTKTKNKATKIAKAAPLKMKESAPEINTEDSDAKVTSGNGEIKTYHVQKGETLMQIAFKLYGDISRWKELRKLNGDKLSSNSSIRSRLTLKYVEPETPFVWNPEGKPYVIKNGETLGIISNNVYQTPKKWKSIWENNKPLIKNPNVIYAGFTLYYKDGQMANYVQPKKEQVKAISHNENKKIVEDIKIENALSEIERLDAGEEIREIKSATVRAPASEEEESIPDTSTTPPVQPEESPEEQM